MFLQRLCKQVCSSLQLFALLKQCVHVHIKLAKWVSCCHGNLSCDYEKWLLSHNFTQNKCLIGRILFIPLLKLIPTSAHVQLQIFQSLTNECCLSHNSVTASEIWGHEVGGASIHPCITGAQWVECDGMIAWIFSNTIFIPSKCAGSHCQLLISSDLTC